MSTAVVQARKLSRLAALSSASDPTPEGKSIVDLYRGMPGTTAAQVPAGAKFVAFTAQTRMSGVDLPDGRIIRKGASDSVAKHVQAQGGTLPARLKEQVDAVASQGATPLLGSAG